MHTNVRLTAIAVAGGALAAALALTGCSSSGADAEPTGSATPGGASLMPSQAATTSRPVDTRTRTVTSIATAPSTGQGSAGGRCLESQLRATIDLRHIPGNGTAGSDGRARHAVLVDFRNTSASACTLYGYPGAAIVDDAGNQVQQARRQLSGSLAGPGRLRTVRLAPGASAAAFLEGHDTREQGAAQAGCEGSRYPRILVTPPNTQVPVPFTVGWPKCYSFDVHPVAALPAAPR